MKVTYAVCDMNHILYIIHLHSGYITQSSEVHRHLCLLGRGDEITHIEDMRAFIMSHPLGFPSHIHAQNSTDQWMSMRGLLPPLTRAPKAM
jgi:hypothetical protein